CEPTSIHHNSVFICQYVLFHSKNCPSDIRSKKQHSHGCCCCQSIFFIVFTDSIYWIPVFVIKILSLYQVEIP
ncbi:unnamed protein product, partial [Lepidochelys olivacea]